MICDEHDFRGEGCCPECFTETAKTMGEGSLRFVCPTCEHTYEIATAESPQGLEMRLELAEDETLCPKCLGRAVRDSRCETCQDLGIECPRGYAAERRCCDVCRHIAVTVYPDCMDEPTCPRCGGTTEGEDED